MSRQTRGPGRFSISYPPERQCMALSQWPEPDRMAFEHARRAGSAFELPGPAALWAASTNRGVVQAYGRYLNFLARNGILCAAKGPCVRLTPDRLAHYVAEARELLSAHTIKHTLRGLRQIVRAMVPEKDWDWITRHPSRPSESEVRASKKTIETFDPRALCCKALDLMDHLNAGPTTLELRVLYRNALIVALQCVFALRKRNLVGMALGRNLVVEEELIRLIFRREETKNFIPISWLVPNFLRPYLLKYIQVHRPALLNGNASNFVWVGSRYHTLRYGAAAHLFNFIGLHLIGRPIACHSFRHSMATAIMTKDPRQLKLVSGALTHGSLRTANQHYDLSGDTGSRRVWDKVRRDIMRGKGPYQS